LIVFNESLRITNPFDKAFGQREPTYRIIHNILREYDCTDDRTVVKELIQNADDAGAQKFILVLDRRTHGSKHLLDSALDQFQGPSLLVYNDATFTPEDERNIQEVGAGVKRTKRGLVGKFGIGFNTIYHFTDLPTFTAGSSYYLFDPHAQYVPLATETMPGIHHLSSL